MMIGLLFSLGSTSPNIASATHTTAGARYWYNVCKTLDAIILEDCGLLTSNHDPRGHGLSPLGWKVAICFAGGILAITGGHPEWLAYGAAMRCGEKNKGSNK